MKNFKLSRYLGIVALAAFSVSVHGQTYTELYNFDCVKIGCNPNQPGPLAQGQDGGLYSTMPTLLHQSISITLPSETEPLVAARGIIINVTDNNSIASNRDQFLQAGSPREGR
jgi:hypothetical protein